MVFWWTSTTERIEIVHTLSVENYHSTVYTIYCLGKEKEKDSVICAAAYGKKNESLCFERFSIGEKETYGVVCGSIKNGVQIVAVIDVRVLQQGRLQMECSSIAVSAFSR